MSASGVIAFLLLLFLLGFTVVHAVEFVLHFVDAANRPGVAMPSAASYVRAFAREWWYTLAVVLSYPLGLLPSPALRTSGDGGPPILLVHGFLMNRMCLFAMYWRLRRLGYSHLDTVNMAPAGGPIETLAPPLARKVRDVSQRCGGAPVICIAHSMGGLVLRWCLQQDAELPVAKLITLGTPHHGTRLAVLGLRPAAKQMQPGSAFLRQLSDDCPVPVTAIYSATDNMVIPAENGAFGAHPIRFADLGHMSLLFDPKVFERIAAQVAGAKSGAEERSSSPQGSTSSMR